MEPRRWDCLPFDLGQAKLDDALIMEMGCEFGDGCESGLTGYLCQSSRTHSVPRRMHYRQCRTARSGMYVMADLCDQAQHAVCDYAMETHPVIRIKLTFSLNLPVYRIETSGKQK